MYLPGEAPSQNVSRELVRICRGEGCTIGAYWWGYASFDPSESVQQAIDLTMELVPECKVLWLDEETYGSPPTIPDEAWLWKAADAYVSLGLADWRGMYTSAYELALAGVHQIADAFPLLWNARYGVDPADMSAGYGGWSEAVAHQYSSTPCDLSMIRSDFT